MDVPAGWKLVPKQLTPEMRVAAKRAMTEHIKKLPPEVRAQMPQYKDNGGIRLATNLKFDLRYEAAVAAAPEPRALTEAAGCPSSKDYIGHCPKCHRDLPVDLKSEQGDP